MKVSVILFAALLSACALDPSTIDSLNNTSNDLNRRYSAPAESAPVRYMDNKCVSGRRGSNGKCTDER